MNAENGMPEKLTLLSQKEFSLLGMNDLAYIRHISTEDGNGFMIHAADGTPLGVAESRELAFGAARRHGLDPQNLH